MSVGDHGRGRSRPWGHWRVRVRTGSAMCLAVRGWVGRGRETGWGRLWAGAAIGAASRGRRINRRAGWTNQKGKKKSCHPFFFSYTRPLLIRLLLELLQQRPRTSSTTSRRTSCRTFTRQDLKKDRAPTKKTKEPKAWAPAKKTKARVSAKAPEAGRRWMTQRPDATQRHGHPRGKRRRQRTRKTQKVT